MRFIARICFFISFLALSLSPAKASDEVDERYTRFGRVNGFLSKHVSLSSYVQLGYAYTGNTQGVEEVKNQYLSKLAMFVLSGDIVDNLSWMIQFEAFSATALELYVYYKPFPFFQIKAGQMKTCFSLENQMSPSVFESVNWDKVAARLTGISGDIVGNSGGRDLGLQIGGELFKMPFDKYFLEYRLGVFNGSGLGLKDHNKAKDVAVWLTLQPVNGLKVGGSLYSGRLNYTWKEADGTNDPIVRTANIDRDRAAVSLLYESKNLNVRGEYIWGKDREIRREGFYAMGNWFVLPARLALLGKIEGYEADKSQSNYEMIYTLGATYYITPKTRFMLNYVCDHYRQHKAIHQGWAQFQIGF